MSAWIAIVMVRIASNLPLEEALKVGIPAPVVAAMGLSVGSFALASGIKDSKRRSTVDPVVSRRIREEVNRLDREISVATIAWAAEKAAADAVQDQATKASLELSVARKKSEVDALTTQLESLKAQLEGLARTEGLLARNEKPEQASAGDLFRGEEVVDATTVDFGKVQMLYLTIGILAAYGFMLANAIDSGELFRSGMAGVNLPDLDESLIALLGISHGGYLAVKAADSTPVAS